MSARNPLLNALTYIESFLKIVTKDNRLTLLHLNQPQQRLYAEIKRQWEAGIPIRIIILKARQMGFSTLTEALIFWMAATACNVRCLIIAHKEKSTAKIFRMARTFYENLPPRLRPMQRASNAQELNFDTPNRYRGKSHGLKSSITCETAGSSGAGRGETYKAVHASEFAFWPGDKKETLTGILQAVPNLPGTMVIIESTANGYDEFKRQWDAAEQHKRDGTPGFYPIFFAWWEMDEYRMPVPAGFQRTEEEQELAEAYNLDDEQLMWRRWCIANNCGDDVNQFHQEYPSCPDEAFLATGQCVFDQDLIIRRRNQVRDEKWEYGAFRITRGFDGKPVKGTWEPEKKGPIRIWKHPEQGVPYVIGGDTAGTGSDYFAAQILDNRTGDQVAVLHRQQMGEREYGEQVYCLGKYYNTALTAIETNYSTYPEMVLEELNYPRLFIREYLDNYTGKRKEAFGFNTNSVSRPLIIDELKDLVKHHIDCIHDYETLGEMLVFIYNDQWRPEAEVGEHDDLVMSLAIANHARRQQTTQTEQQIRDAREGRSKWTKDMLEDYKHANAEERAYLIRKWGPPN